MQRALHILTLCLLPFLLPAQNMVNNPSFETMAACPDYYSQLERATGWYRPTDGTSDYFNSCADLLTWVSVPTNHTGTQTPRTGNAYAGFYCYSLTGMGYLTGLPDTMNREYLQSQLTAPMVPGQTYQVTFYVNKSEGLGNGYFNCATYDIGACFSVDPLLSFSSPWSWRYLDREPQVKNPVGNYITDSTGWTKISSCFRADSAYRYITIGCFKGADISLLHLNSTWPGADISYYYIDDVSVVPDSEWAVTITGDTMICNGEPAILTALYSSGNLLWSTGDTTASITVNAAGIYTLVDTLGGCVYTDSVSVTAATTAVNLGTDTVICNIPVYTVGVQTPDPTAVYTWSTGDTGTSITVIQSGLYWAQHTIGQCATTDTVLITLQQNPVVWLGADRFICDHEFFELEAGNANGSQIMWSTGDTVAAIIIDRPGKYNVVVTNACGTGADSLTILDGGNCTCPVYLPNAFSPGGDGLNESFGISTTCELQSYEIWIFDRWGQVIFNSRNGNEKWNGAGADGVYAWKLAYIPAHTTVVKQQYLQGHVTVLR